MSVLTGLKSSLCNAQELFMCRPLFICAVCINYRLKEAGENFDPHFIIIITVSFSAWFVQFITLLFARVLLYLRYNKAVIVLGFIY